MMGRRVEGRTDRRTSPMATQAPLCKYTGVLPPPEFLPFVTHLAYFACNLLLQEAMGSLQFPFTSDLMGPGVVSHFGVVLLQKAKPGEPVLGGLGCFKV